MRQCVFCDKLSFRQCNCVTDIKILHAPRSSTLARLKHALGEGQRARFEFGETGKPRPYARPSVASSVRVYVAGAIFRLMGPNEAADVCGTNEALDTWRAEIFQCEAHQLSSEAEPIVGRFVYAGPTIVDNHGCACEGLADNCLDEVADADALFAWIDCEETIGTLVEIGAARAGHKPTFITFANGRLAEHFYFIKQLATVAVITPDVMAAWKLFTRWQANT